MKRILAILLALTLTLCAFAALAEEEDYGDTIVVGSTTEMKGNFFSEMFGNNTADIDVRTLLHGYNLIHWMGEMRSGSYGINPMVVSGVMALDDPAGNRIYTVTINSDLTYSDGTPITTKDYAFSILLSAAPEMKAIGAQTVESDYIVGSDEYKAGKTNVLAGMHLLSDTMMTFMVKAEYEPFFYELDLINYTPYPISVIAPGCEVVDEGDGVQIRNIDQTIEEPIFTAELLRETVLDPETGYLSHPSVVSGPYVLDSYDAETHVATFSINPYFKGDPDGVLPSIEHLVYRPVNPDTMMDELMSGEVDLLNKCTSAAVIDQGNALVENGGFRSSNYPRNGYSFVSFSCERPAMGSEIVRKAIAHCLNKNALVPAYVGDYGIVVDGYYGIGQWMFSLAIGMQAPPVEVGQDTSAWNSVNLNNITIYPFDVQEAIRLLEKDGWTLNRDGEPYNQLMDDVRCKEINGELIALDLKMIYPEGNAIGDSWERAFLSNLAQAGIVVTIEAKPMTELLDIYYRNVEREYDLIYLATNFSRVFNPSYTYSPEDAYQGKSNRSGIVDEELYQRALDMGRTQPGDVLSYCRKWVAFQERWTQVLPSIPVYSNVYYDFYVNTLHNYVISADQTWAEVIVKASIGAPVTGEEEEPEEELVEEPEEEETQGQQLIWDMTQLPPASEQTFQLADPL